MNKTFYIISIFIFVYMNIIYSQSLCLSQKIFRINEFALRADVQSSAYASFDIVDFKAVNIQIDSINSFDNSFFQEFVSDTKYNLNQITFLKNSLNYSLKINYIIKPSANLSNKYAEIINEHEINLVFPALGLVKGELIDYKYVESDSLIFTAYIPYKSGSSLKSDIIVEKIFNHLSDSTIIIKNNHPELTEEILKIAKTYSKYDFLRAVPRSKKYFIRYYIIRKLEECGYEEIF